MSAETKTAEQLATEIKAAHARSLDEVRAIAEQAVAEAKRGVEMTTALKEKADEGLLTTNELKAQLTEIEQKLARRGAPEVQDERKSLGEIVVGNEEFKNRLSGSDKRGSVSMTVETKTILSASGSWGATSSVSNALVVADRQPLVALPMRQMTVRDLFSPGETNSNGVEFAVQTARTNNAAVVAENTTKAYSNYTWNLQNFPVRTIAHLVKASRQILDDAPALKSTIDAEMRYGLEFAEEAQMLYGDGTGANLLGVIPQATAYSAAFAVTGETAIDRIRLAMLQGTLALYPMTGHVLNPADWTKIEMLKDAQGRYIIGDPQGTVAPRLWGLPVVSSIAMTAGTFLTGAFKYGGQIFDRMAIEVMISTENVDDFEKNMISIRAEERLALVIKRPASFITGNLP
ncbi:Hypothetical predicted protein, partial [Olea europaea subsp. europaea]